MGTNGNGRLLPFFGLSCVSRKVTICDLMRRSTSESATGVWMGVDNEDLSADLLWQLR